MIKRFLFMFLAILFLAGCSINDILNKTMGITVSQTSTTNADELILPDNFDIRLDGVWMFGGTNSTEMVSNVDRYNPYTDTWESNVTTMPARVRNFAAAAYGTKIYIFGGINTNNMVTNLVQIYDVISNTWSIGTNMPAVRQGHGAVTYGDRIYIFGGSSTVLAAGGQVTAYQYHPTINTNPWSGSLGNLVYANTVMDFGYTIFDGEILYAGGRSTAGTASASASTILPLIMTSQSATGLLKLPRFGVCAASFTSPTSKYAFFIGGTSISDTEQFPTPTITSSDKVCVYFPYSEQGIRVVLAGPRLIQSRAYAQACVKGNYLFVFGGMVNTTVFLNSVERISITSLFTSTWKNRSPMPNPRAGFCAVTLR
jgi:hypothetical protein